MNNSDMLKMVVSLLQLGQYYNDTVRNETIKKKKK